MSDQSIVEVTQADRQRMVLYENAGAIFLATSFARDILDGKYDSDHRVQAFARHRIAEREACAMVAERIGECANTSGRSGCCETTGDDIAAAIRARGDRVDDISYAGVGP